MIKSAGEKVMLKKCMVILALGLCSWAVWADERDVNGAADIAGLGRYPGSYIAGVSKSDYSALAVPQGANTWEAPDSFVSFKVEGERQTRVYTVPNTETDSRLAVMRSLQAGLVKAGFVESWSCVDAACGSFFPRHIFSGDEKSVHSAFEQFINLNDTINIIAAAKESAAGRECILVVVGKTKYYPHIQYSIDWLREAALPVVDLVLTEDKLQAGLDDRGAVTLGGLQFGYDSVEMVGNSEQVLDVLVGYLRAAVGPAQYLVVGHTDSKGSHDYNLGLSQRRADAVVAALIQRGVPENLLLALGVGSAAPLASNRTDAGRQENRRVELVEVIQ